MAPVVVTPTCLPLSFCPCRLDVYVNTLRRTGACSWCSVLAHSLLQDDSQHCSGSPEDTPRSSGASGVFSLRNLAADSLLPTLLERAAPEDVDRRNEALRRQHRAPALLTLYPAPDEVGALWLAHCPQTRIQPSLAASCIPIFS